eukprot:5923138-Amphidinium_carterae.1
MDSKEMIVDKIKELQRSGTEGKTQWWAYCQDCKDKLLTGERHMNVNSTACNDKPASFVFGLYRCPKLFNSCMHRGGCNFSLVRPISSFETSDF